jgi:hypothetical protein
MLEMYSGGRELHKMTRNSGYYTATIYTVSSKRKE